MLLLVEGALRLSGSAEPARADVLLYWTRGKGEPVVVAGKTARLHPDLRYLGNAAPEFSREPEPGVCRVVCVGDSATAGWPYQPLGSYPRFLERVLDGRGRRFEVLDAGLQGFDSARLADVSKSLARFKPCAAVLRFGYNDAHHFAFRRRPASLAWRLHSYLSARSRLYAGMRAVSGRAPTGLTLLPLSEELTPELNLALASDFERNLKAAARAFKDAGAEVVILGLPYSKRLDAPETFFDGLELLETSARQIARDTGAVFDPLEEADKDALFVDNVHSTLEGNALVAAAAARAVCSFKSAGCAGKGAAGKPALAGDFLAHADVRLASLFAARDLEDEAVAALARAEAGAATDGLVLRELCGFKMPKLLRLLARADAKLGRTFAAGRAKAAADGNWAACEWMPLDSKTRDLPLSAASMGLTLGPFPSEAMAREHAAHVEVRLAIELATRKREDLAVAALMRAETSAPNRELVLRELVQRGFPRLVSLLARADERLGRTYSATRAHQAAARLASR